MNEKDKSTAELIRAATRPVLMLFLLLGSFVFIMEGLESTWVNAWNGLFIFGVGEWIIERPVGKVLKGVNITRRE